MKLPWLIVLLSLAAPSLAHAQVGIYGLGTTTHLSGTGTQSTWFYGPGAGLYYDFAHFGPLSGGLDLRGNYLYGSSQTYRSGLIGIRISAHAPILPINPYIQGSVGVGGAKANSAATGITPVFSNKFQYAVLGGVDVTVLPRIDLRIPEIGYGSMSGVSSSTSAPSVNLLTISAGIVVRLP